MLAKCSPNYQENCRHQEMHDMKFQESESRCPVSTKLVKQRTQGHTLPSRWSWLPHVNNLILPELTGL